MQFRFTRRAACAIVLADLGRRERESGRTPATPRTGRRLVPRAVVSAIVTDPGSGDLWIGTLGSGLLRYSAGRIDRFTQFNSGIAGDQVLDVEFWNGRVWCATGSGVSSFDSRTGTWTLSLERRGDAPQVVIEDLAVVPALAPSAGRGRPARHLVERAPPALRHRDGRLDPRRRAVRADRACPAGDPAVGRRSARARRDARYRHGRPRFGRIADRADRGDRASRRDGKDDHAAGCEASRVRRDAGPGGRRRSDRPRERPRGVSRRDPVRAVRAHAPVRAPRMGDPRGHPLDPRAPPRGRRRRRPSRCRLARREGARRSTRDPDRGRGARGACGRRGRSRIPGCSDATGTATRPRLPSWTGSCGRSIVRGWRCCARRGRARAHAWTSGCGGPAHAGTRSCWI